MLNFFKVLNLFGATLCLMLTVLSSSVMAMLDFKEGQEFRSGQANSPLFLRYSNKVNVTNFGFDLKRPGFNIYSHMDLKNPKHIGYMTFELDDSRKIVEITSAKIEYCQQKKGYGTEALRVITRVLRTRHLVFFAWATHYLITVKDPAGPAARIALKDGFQVSNRFLYPPHVTEFEKPIHDDF